MPEELDMYVQALHESHNKVLRKKRETEIAENSRAKVAVIAVDSGVSGHDVTRLLGVAPSTVNRWVAAAKAGAEEH